MTNVNPILIVPLLLLAVVAGAFVRQTVLLLRARRRDRRRVIEKPNSFYTPQAVREREDRERWHAIDMARVHEINREEITRLLQKVEGLGAAALRPNERMFLDRMLELSTSIPEQ
jgi:hypothetical protein